MSTGREDVVDHHHALQKMARIRDDRADAIETTRDTGHYGPPCTRSARMIIRFGAEPM
jgi:hypothetical protein